MGNGIENDIKHLSLLVEKYKNGEDVMYKGHYKRVRNILKLGGNLGTNGYLSQLFTSISDDICLIELGTVFEDFESALNRYKPELKEECPEIVKAIARLNSTIRRIDFDNTSEKLEDSIKKRQKEYGSIFMKYVIKSFYCPTVEDVEQFINERNRKKELKLKKKGWKIIK